MPPLFLLALLTTSIRIISTEQFNHLSSHLRDRVVFLGVKEARVKSPDHAFTISLQLSHASERIVRANVCVSLVPVFKVQQLHPQLGFVEPLYAYRRRVRRYSFIFQCKTPVWSRKCAQRVDGMVFSSPYLKKASRFTLEAWSRSYRFKMEHTIQTVGEQLDSCVKRICFEGT